MYIFITGTDTDVGKSYVAKGIFDTLKKMGEKTAYLKPFQSGMIDGVPSDAQYIGEGAYTSYVTKTPSTPFISAEIDGVEYDIKKVVSDFNNLKKQNDNVIVEGSGGIYVPVKKGVLMADVIAELNLPTLIVARPDLGTINHTLMTIDCLLCRELRILGVVISNYPKNTKDPVISRAKEMIEMFSGQVKVLDIIEQNQKDFSFLISKLVKPKSIFNIF